MNVDLAGRIAQPLSWTCLSRYPRLQLSYKYILPRAVPDGARRGEGSLGRSWLATTAAAGRASRCRGLIGVVGIHGPAAALQPGNPPSRQIVGRELQQHTVARDDTNETRAHLAADVG